MRIANDGDSEGGMSGTFAELFRVQAEFQAKLTEETFRYLRRLQGALAPAAPGTIVAPDATASLAASGAPGAPVELRLDVENVQRVHCLVTPQLTPLASAVGATWYPAVDAGQSYLIAPGAVETVVITLTLPAALPPGTYRGALILQGFRDGAIPVTVTAAAPAAEKRQATSKRSRRRR
jgi:hypothetical protein